MSIISFSPFGYEGCLVSVEVDLRRGIPAVDIVGLSDGCVASTRERVKSAISNQNLEFPSERVLISLSPADVKKEGAGFDLPIALAILVADAELKDKLLHSQDEKVMVLGELELSGKIRPVKGITAALQTAVDSGIKYAIIPKDSEKEPDGILCYRAETLEEAFYALSKVDDCDTEDAFYELTEKQAKEKKKVGFAVEFPEVEEWETHLDSIKGNNGLKYAMAVAVAGRHSILVYGAPGCGKTMLLQNMTQLLPKLTAEEKHSVDRIYSIAGMGECIKNDRRPFRMPHQTASLEGMCGGGLGCRPGEISLAHNGVLFLDEAAEFKTSVLQMLRVPLETHHITLSRAGRSTVYPADFQLVMATNPCPCGNYGVKDRMCLCSMKSVEMYWKKFSAPLLDRVAIRFNANADYDTKELTDSASVLKDWSLEELRNMIKNAWIVQHNRQGKLNNDLTPEEVANIPLTRDAEETIREYKDKYSPRKFSNLIKLARTLQDMRGVCGCASTEVDYFAVLGAIKLIGELPGIVEDMM